MSPSTARQRKAPAARRHHPWWVAFVAMGVVLLLCGCGASYTVRHTVKPGETLYKIAQRHGTSVEELRRLNHLEKSDVIRSGDLLFVPGAPDPGKRKSTSSASSSPTKKSATPSAKSPSKRSAPKVKLAWPVDGKVAKAYDAVGRGIDLHAAQGGPVRCAAPGKVTYAGTPAPAYGAMAIVAHGNDLFTVYSHLGRLEVKGGDRVETGQLIGRANARGAIHFEVRQGKQPQDPLLYLPRR